MEGQLVAERRSTSIDFFFDPQCPFAYQASLWIRDVSAQTGLRVSWRFFSLEEANYKEDEQHPWEKPWSSGWSLMRVGAWLRAQDSEMLDRWYAAVGKAIHEEGRPAYEREIAEQIIGEHGFPADTIERALADPSTNDAVRQDHEWLTSTHGGFGVPTLVFASGKAMYGPVVAPAPPGGDAIHLWNVVLDWIAIPNLYEFKAPKTEEDTRHIKEALAPTFRAREAALSS
jgi:2-hydroxychromene-2-carboxylate isomerase